MMHLFKLRVFAASSGIAGASDTLYVQKREAEDAWQC